MSDEWRVPAPEHDPEARKARLVRDDEGRARLVPERDFVEGEYIESDDGDEAAPPGTCPFSH